MPPVIIDIGIGSIRTYTLAVAAGVLIITLLYMCKLERSERARTVDVLLLALALALALARVEHVLLNWAYFADTLNEILLLSAGGLGWHGAVLGALVGLGIGWRVRLHPSAHKQFARLLDALAFGIPVLMLAAWFGCWSAGCGYGYEVATLADYPSLIAAELPDTYGVFAPRLNTPVFGMAWAVLVLLVAWRAQNRGGRFWLLLALVSLGMFLIGFARANNTLIILGLRVDQVLDLIVFGFSAVCLLRARPETKTV